MWRTHWPRAKHIIPRSLHTLLEPNHVRRDLHDRGKQGERATPRSAQSHTVVHYLANEVLHTPTVVLHRLVEPLFLEGQAPALPFCDDLPLPDVSLVPNYS